MVQAHSHRDKPGPAVVPRSAWEITHIEELPSGRRYTAELGDMEWVVLHVPGGWQFWNGYSRCEANGGLRAAILDFEHDDPIQSEPTRRDLNTRS